MIDWLYQSNLDISIMLLVILIIRNPVRRMLGAHVSYWLWSLPLLRLIIGDKFDRPDVITQYLTLPDSSGITQLYSSPIQASNSQIEIIGIIWLMGFLVWSVLKITQAIKFKTLLGKHSTLVLNSDYISESLLQKFKFNIQLKICSAIQGPLISGLFKPTIYLPENFIENYSEAERKLILEHELTHAKRQDLWAQLLAELFKAVFWFNPLVHIAWTKFQLDQEMACDHQVLKHSDLNTRSTYGETLKKGLSALLTPNSLTFFNHQHERFIMLSKHKNSIFTTLTGIAFIATLGLMLLTKTGISLAEKSETENGMLVSFHFERIPLDRLAKLIAKTTDQEESLENLNLLKGIEVNTKVENVYAFDYLDEMLKNNGLKVDRQIDKWNFSKL